MIYVNGKWVLENYDPSSAVTGYNVAHPEAVKGYVGPSSIPKGDSGSSVQYQPSVPVVKSYPVQVPQFVQAAATTTPTAVSASTQAVLSDRDKRMKLMQDETGWDNDPTARALQQKSWAIFVDTGGWNSPEQIKYHDDAERIRKANNPMYTGRPWGPYDAADANSISLPDTQPNVGAVQGAVTGGIKNVVGGLLGVTGPQASSMLTLGVGAFLVIMVTSMFRR